MLTPKPKLYSSDWSPGMVVLKNVPNQDWGPKSCANFLGSSGSNALKQVHWFSMIIYIVRHDMSLHLILP